MELDDVTLYTRWLKGISRDRPDYISKHMIARFLQVKIWELKDVPVHYMEEAVVILTARHRARMDIAAKATCSPEKVILPDY